MGGTGGRASSSGSAHAAPSATTTNSAARGRRTPSRYEGQCLESRTSTDLPTGAVILPTHLGIDRRLDATTDIREPHGATGRRSGHARQLAGARSVHVEDGPDRRPDMFV